VLRLIRLVTVLCLLFVNYLLALFFSLGLPGLVYFVCASCYLSIVLSLVFGICARPKELLLLL